MNEVSSNKDAIIGYQGPNHHVDDDKYLGFSSECTGKPWGWGSKHDKIYILKITPLATV